MTRKQKRLAVIAGGMSFILAAVLLVMFAFSQSVAYFYMPGDLAKTPVAPGTRIRLGGLVGAGSVLRGEGSVVRFAVTDPSGEIVTVRYQGILPDLFREGQGVVTEGTFETGSNIFTADTVLAKHDETYMPKDVADRLKAQGLWEEGKGGSPQGQPPQAAEAKAQEAKSQEARAQETKAQETKAEETKAQETKAAP
ncbi:cytochrome c maturation protein CcmE [Rhizobium mesosinicum]|uniref:Cytochrome c-type biogenesis protein CcmE n=1 Tax=Rhizobium mesosinicum TaxID=335017 RepID=A0ABS7GTE9_9HYPH|nr:cytochrome c maturation protein CcmE [Rhizobium mesosinicum]MBW9052932.1 cytochrome c maturation protein CcmE [Rhizobium mesosinicum]